MKYAVEMASGAMIYIQSFIKNWFRHSDVVVEWVDSRTHRQQGDPINLLLFFFSK
jgi:hypothetical protein